MPAPKERQSIEVKSERTVLAAVRLPDSRYDPRDPFGELRELAKQSGAKVVGELEQRIQARFDRYGERNPDELERVKELKARYASYQSVLDPYHRLLRAEMLGTLDEEFSEAEAQAVFADYVELIRKMEGRELSDSEFEEYAPELEYRSP